MRSFEYPTSLFCLQSGNNTFFESIIICHNLAIESEESYTNDQKEAWLWDSENNNTLIENIGDKKNKTLLATDKNNNVLGFIIIDFETNEITALYVGTKKNGVGKTLLKYAVQELNGNVSLYSSAGAIGFYLKFNFREMDTIKMMMNGQEFKASYLLYDNQQAGLAAC